MSPVRRGVLGALVVLVAGGGGWAWYTRPLPSAMLDFEPIDDHRVVAFRRDARPGSPAMYVELYDTKEGRRFQHTLRGAYVFPDVWGLVPSVVLGEDALVVRDVVGKETFAPRLVGLSLSGRERWDTAPMGSRVDAKGSAFGLINVSLSSALGVVLAFFGRDGRLSDVAETVAYDATSGKERWRVSSVGKEGAFGPAWVRGSSLVLSTYRAVEIVDLTTGAMRRIAMDGVPCVTHGALVYAEGGTLHAMAWTNQAARAIAATDVRLFGTCATRGGLVWLTVAQGQNETDSSGKIALFAPAFALGIDLATGEVAKRIPLGDADLLTTLNESRVEQSAPERAALSEDAPRFVPLLFKTTGNPVALSMLDLDEAHVAWATTPNERFAFGSIQRVGSTHYLTESMSHLFAAIDGNNGHLLAAIRYPHMDTRPKVNGGVWISDRFEIARLDPLTLARTWSTGDIEIADARADTELLLAPR